MKILFDYQIFQLQSYGGISRYFTKLAESFIKLKHEITIHCPVYKSGFENIKKFTWESCAKNTVEIYKRGN